MVDGAYIKVNVLKIEQLQMTVAEAQVKVEAGLIKCPELETVNRDLSLSIKRWTNEDNDLEANEKMMTNTYFSHGIACCWRNEYPQSLEE